MLNHNTQFHTQFNYSDFFFFFFRLCCSSYHVTCAALSSLLSSVCLCCIQGTTTNIGAFKGCWNITRKNTSKYVYKGYSNIPFKMSWYIHKKFHFFISNIWYVFSGLLWIKLIFVRFANQRILFLFLFYTVYEISWSWGCIWPQKILLFK